MKQKIFIWLIAATVLQSCCYHKGAETSRFTISTQEKALIPYQQDQVISMKHSQGHEFEAVASVNSHFFSDQEHCEDYSSYESYNVELTSAIPNFKINLGLHKYFIDDDWPTEVSMSINRNSFGYNEQAPLETVVIENISYNDVYRYSSYDPDFFISEVLFNNSEGIIKILYSDGEHVQINQ